MLLHQPRAAAPGYRLPEFDLRLTFGPGDFLQGNADVNRALVARARSNAHGNGIAGAGFLQRDLSPASPRLWPGKLIRQGYRLERLCLADMFPRTSHVETVTLFRR